MGGLILIRHAETAVSATIPSREWGLTENGRLQAKQFAKKLPILPTILYTSAEEKAKETGDIIADIFGVTSQIALNIHEHDRTGVSFSPSRAVFEDRIFTFFTKPDQLVFGRETASEALTRFSRAVIALHQGRITDPSTPLRTGVVTHGTVITLFICHHNPTLRSIDFWHRLTMPCAFYLDKNYQLTHAVFNV